MRSVRERDESWKLREKMRRPTFVGTDAVLNFFFYSGTGFR